MPECECNPIDLRYPYGATPLGFTGKSIFADLKRLVSDCSVVVTAGAYDGQEPLTYRHMFPEAWIHCVEPTPSLVREVETLFADDDKVRVHPVALSDVSGTTTFRISSEGSSSLFPLDSRVTETIPAAAVAPVRSIEVATRTLDDLCAESGIERIDLLALDVQGAELHVLRGAARLLAERRIRWLTVELIFVPVYEGQHSFGELATFLERAGFKLRDFYNFAYSEDGQLLWGDALYRLNGR